MKTREQMEEIRSALQQIAANNGGLLTPEAVFEAAKNKASPLHGEFEWDKAKAFTEHNLYLARALIRSVRIEVKTETTVIKTVAYVRDPDLPADEQGYVSTVSLRADADRARAAIVQEFSRAASALRRARELAVALDMSGEVDAVAEELTILRTKVEARVEQRASS